MAKRPRAVRAIAVELGAHVEDHEFSRADLPLAGLGVRESAVLPGRDDRRKGWLGAELADPRLTGARDLPLGPPGEAALDRPAKDTVGELGGGDHPLDLLGLLHGAELLHEIARRNEIDPLAERGLQPGELPNAQLGVLEADPSGHPRGDLRNQLALGLGTLPFLPDLRGGALGVAEVGEEDPLLATDQAGPVGPRETGQVADVRQVGDEELVELALRDQLDEAVRPAHTPSCSAISFRASR